jgi:hypothetical protein
MYHSQISLFYSRNFIFDVGRDDTKKTQLFKDMFVPPMDVVTLQNLTLDIMKISIAHSGVLELLLRDNLIMVIEGCLQNSQLKRRRERTHRQ